MVLLLHPLLFFLFFTVPSAMCHSAYIPIVVKMNVLLIYFTRILPYLLFLRFPGLLLPLLSICFSRATINDCVCGLFFYYPLPKRVGAEVGYRGVFAKFSHLICYPPLPLSSRIG